jgi:mono/diheme cytochrome c family protein
MEVLGVLLPFVLIGIGVIFVAFTGGPGRAREVYLTRGGRGFRVMIPLLYLGLGVGVPAAVIAARDESRGGVGRLETASLDERGERGKQLFRQTCGSCHDLDAVNTLGVTGPDLDEIGQVSEQRVLGAIRLGGTGQKRMPSNLLRGEDARDVAFYVARVAGKGPP